MGSSNIRSKDSSSSSDDDEEPDKSSRRTAVHSSNPNSGVFSEGERVLAYHGPRIYEAKIQKAELRNKEWRYFVHYLGWNKNWDEWVGSDRLLKHTEENVLKQQTIEKKQGADKSTKTGRSVQAKPKSSIDSKVDKDEKSYAAKGKKRKSDSGIEVYTNSCLQKDNASVEKPVKIQIPPSLKKQLVDDWEYINRQDKLIKLPRSLTVDDVLAKYLAYISKKDGTMTDSVGEILKGLRCYFDKALPVLLLYKKERSQYHEAIADNVSPSTIYGAEHLLRLFVKLPDLFSYVNIEEETLLQLQQNLHDFLKFLQKNQGSFFLSAYDDCKVARESGKSKDD